MNRLLTAALLAALLIILTVVFSVGGDDSSSEDSGSGEPTVVGEGASTADTDLDTKPELAAPKGPAPDELVINDIVEGDGDEATAGSQVTVQYVGIDYDSGEQFDASWDRGDQFPFSLGGGQVIPGWDQGVEGMKVGGRRELIIPPDLAYGQQGQPPDIKPNATLVFVIDLVDFGAAQ